ncbi:MAG: L17 family ribosomal protein [Candidatus Dojkabacteria bacterium]|nr:L17 family ribosomal protein [Candidatus Dojkabacteria bacterium]
MYKGVKKAKLGRKASNRNLLVLNLQRSLFLNGQLTTTTPKAKVLKSKVERVISKIKTEKNLLILRRELKKILGTDVLVNKALEYGKNEKTGIIIRKIGFRKGDNAQVSKVLLIGMEKKKKKVAKKGKDDKKEKKQIKIDAKELEKRSERKDVDKKAVIVNKERAKTRSGL